MSAKEVPQYAEAVSALVPVLFNVPGKLIAIDGRPGVGKTTLGRYLSWRFNITLLETDVFLIPRQGKFITEMRRSTASSPSACRSRSQSLWMVAVLRLLASLHRKPDFHIYAFHPEAPESFGSTAADLAAYDETYRAAERADLVLRLAH